jgi:hypothetical protein
MLSLLNSPFPMDAFFAALAASPAANVSSKSWRDWRRLLASALETRGAPSGSVETVHSYGAGSTPWRRLDRARVADVKAALCVADEVLARAPVAATAPASAPASAPAAHAPGAEYTGRTVVLPLRPRAEAEVALPGLLAARPGASVDDAAARWAIKGARELGKLYAGGRTTVVLREFVDGAGRLGYDGDGVGRGIRSVMKEVRTAAFAYACSVDLSRAHLEALLQAWAAEVEAGGPAKDQRELRRLVEDRDAVEAELAADQARLSAGGPVQDHVGRLLEMPPKTLLSALVNKAPSSSFGPFHRAARVCRALGFARQAANRHPLVRAEPLRAPLTEPVRLGRAARVLERHAVGCIVDACAAAGLEPGLTLNDEVFAARAPTDAVAQAALLHKARARMRERLGFALPLRMQVF